jgi:T5orf172 domain
MPQVLSHTLSLSRRARASVYVLQRLDRSRFKIGWALDPLKRVRQLPEFNQQLIDLHRSSVLWLPSRHRAEQVERSMQKSLGPYRLAAEHHGDGCTEWFDGVAHRVALRLLGQIPVDTHTGTTGRLLSLQPELDLEAASSGGVSPLEAWWALEDLWLRAAQGMAVTVDLCGPVMRITVHRLRAGWDGPMAELRRPLLDLDTYRWRQDGQAGCFVSLLAPEGEDVVATLTPTRVIEGWPDGGDLVYLVRALLLRLKEMINGRRRP